MKAVIITAGSELTGGRVADTNTAWLARALEKAGYMVAFTLTAPDSVQAIGEVLDLAMRQEADLIVMSGGLGPTDDDLTAAAVALKLGLPLLTDGEATRMVAEAAGRPVDDLRPHEMKQATLPEGAVALRPAGRAPGFYIKHRRVRLISFPGVPHELRQMWREALVDPRLAPLFTAFGSMAHASLRLYGVGEPAVNESVREALAEADAGDAMAGDGREGLRVSVCARYFEIEVDITAPGESEALVLGLRDALRARLVDAIFSEGEPIEEVVGRELTAVGTTLATGESCTGGMLGEVITSVSGSSGYYLGGVIAYHNDVKKAVLRVRQEILDNVGAVSEPVAQQLALGVRALTGAGYGIGITGVAGPSGGTAEKPVGLVYICVSSEKGDVVRGFNFPGGRDDVRRSAVVAALHMLHRKIAEDISSAL